jgi:hypothetical protein
LWTNVNEELRRGARYRNKLSGCDRLNGGTCIGKGFRSPAPAAIAPPPNEVQPYANFAASERDIEMF